MNVLGIPLILTNKIGVYSVISLLLLVLLYLMRPKPVKKIIPSLIFLESNRQKHNFSGFFRKFIKDWLFLLQLLILILLCLAASGLAAEIYSRKLSSEAVFVIDASASSQADDNEILFEKYISAAKKNLGMRNTIILAKNTPEIVARQTNMLNSMRILGSLKPTESLSNIWDAMMIASEISPGANVYVLSDFVDTNGKDLDTAKKILEAKGLKVELFNFRKSVLSNQAIISYALSANNLIIDVKNYDSKKAEVTLKNTGDKKEIEPNAIKQFSVEVKEGLNKIELQTEDDFKVDDTLYFLMPKGSSSSVLYITNRKKSFIYSALSAIKSLKIEKAEPPIIPVKGQNIIVLDGVDYSVVLPGTIDQIRDAVANGASLIIVAQDKLDAAKIESMLPVLIEDKKQDVAIINERTEKFNAINFGQSSRYYEAALKSNSSIIIAKANDKAGSPVIVLSRLGAGSILFYGIFDDANAFRSSTQYPLFWIYAIENILSKDDYKRLNLKSGDMLYGSEIRSPGGEKLKEYTSIESAGVYKTSEKEIAASLLSMAESDLNSRPSASEFLTEIEAKKVRQEIGLLPVTLSLVLILSFLELNIIKKRGDI